MKRPCPSDDAALGVHGWGAKISRRYFCRTCGVHCFARDGRHDNWEAGPRATPWPIRGAEAA